MEVQASSGVPNASVPSISILPRKDNQSPNGLWNLLMSPNKPNQKSGLPIAPFHYCPPDGYFGDPIPFFWKDEYHLFYLIGQFDPWRRVKYTPYRHLLSTDLVNWKELPVAIDLGAREDIDMSLGTGTLIERNGTFYFFYCGRTFLPGDGDDEIHWERGARETVCLATSKDLITWEKDLRNPLILPDGERYQLSDFRDPFVFWNESESCYWMVISVKVSDSSMVFVGGLALATSEDFETWELHDTFWNPNLSNSALECPDIFQMGNKWYLFYSANATTLYRMAERPEGPWEPAEPDVHDNLTYYAAKTMYDGNRRFLFGWISTRENESDSGRVQWGGHCAIPRELIPLQDGSLAQRCPHEITDLYRREVPLALQDRLGIWMKEDEVISGSRSDGYAYAVVGNESNCLISATVKLHGANCSAGIVFRASSDLSTYYALRLESARRRVIIERIPHNKEVKFLSERHLCIDEGESIDIQLFLDGSIVEAFVGGRRALCSRIYDFGAGEIGLYVEHGKAVFEDLRILRDSDHL
jgi:beta-fructofuranosidase